MSRGASAALARPLAAGAGDGGREAPREFTWAELVAAVHVAIARRDWARAAEARDAAHRAAQASACWEGMLAVGEAILRLGEARGARAEAAMEARRLTLAGLYRARARGSIEGVLRAAESFAALADGEMAEQCLRIAVALAARRGGDPGLAQAIPATRRRLARCAAEAARAPE